MVFADNSGAVLRQPGQFAPGGGGPTRRSWRCGPCERESELEGYGSYGVTAPMLKRSLWSDVGGRGLGIHARNHWHRSDMHGYQVYSQGPEAAAVTASEIAAGGSTFRSIAIGVATGLAVWTVTRFLDHTFLRKGRR